MVEKMYVKSVGNYTETDWQNPRTGERKKIKSITLVLQNGREGYVAEANDEVAERIRDMKLAPDTPVAVSLYFEATQSTKDNVVRYFQRVRIENVITLTF